MKPWYAIGARRLLDDRKAGLVPTGVVSVVLTDSPEPAPALYVKADMPLAQMDWRMLVNLDVLLLASPAVPMERWMRVAREIAAVRPHRLTLRFDVNGETHDVDVGHGLHFAGYADFRPFHEFTWSPMDLTRTDLGAKLRRALVQELPMWSAI